MEHLNYALECTSDFNTPGTMLQCLYFGHFCHQKFMLLKIWMNSHVYISNPHVPMSSVKHKLFDLKNCRGRHFSAPLNIFSGQWKWRTKAEICVACMVANRVATSAPNVQECRFCRKASFTIFTTGTILNMWKNHVVELRDLRRDTREFSFLFG